MSHTWRFGNTTFIGNSDLSGDITILVQRDGADQRISVPGEDLIAFVRQHMAAEQIAWIEQNGPFDLRTITQGFPMIRHGKQ